MVVVDPDVEIGIARRLMGPGLSNKRVELIKSWLDTCDRELICREPQQSFLPTRLLDVGVSDSTIRLVTSFPRAALGAQALHS